MQIGYYRHPMKYKLVLWDFDGTLADTLTLALGIYNRMAAERKYRVITDPYAVRHMGMREFLKTHNIPMHRIPFVFSTFLKEIRKYAAEIKLYDGVASVVGQIGRGEIKQGVVSSNSTETIRCCMEKNNADMHFDYMSGTSGIFGKEKRIKKAFQKFNIAPQEVLYIGDEIRDIEASRAAGVDIAAVTWGLNSAEALTAQDPTYHVASPDGLMSILQS